LDELIGEDNTVRVIDAFIDALDLRERDFGKAQSEYHAGISTLGDTAAKLTPWIRHGLIYTVEKP